jgi:hypothetical protein
MSREPPRNVYSNNRLRKIAPAPNPITRHQTADQSSHQQQYSTFASSGVKVNFYFFMK